MKSAVVKMKMTCCPAIVFLLGLGVHMATLAAFYVSPSGNDRDPGTENRPFRSLARARDAVRQINGQMTADIIVHLDKGVYPLSDTVVFGPEDSGCNGHKVVYRAAAGHEAILTGGVKAGKWSVHDAERNIFRARVGATLFRQLYVNGKPAIRARTPNRESEKDLSPYWPCRVPEKPKMQISREHWAAVAGIPVEKREEVELVMICHWYHQRVRIGDADVSDDQVVITPANPSGKFNKTLHFYQNNRGIKNPFYFENALAFVDAPFEWYHDPEGGYLYLALPAGTKPDTLDVEIPMLETLVAVTGRPDAPVHNIAFDGIVLQSSNWSYPSRNGVNMTQAAQVVAGEQPPGMVSAKHVRRFRFRNNVVRNAGGHGIALFDADLSDIEGNEFYAIAANGIDIDRGGGRNPPPGKQTIGMAIWNNHARKCGNHYSNGDFLFAGNVRGLIVEHNRVHDMPYSGMQIGQQPGSMQDVGCGDNIIRFNHVHHCNQIHGDGGGIYTLGGIQEGSIIASNYVHDLRQPPWDHYRISYIYLDNYTSKITVRDNVVKGGRVAQRNGSKGNVLLRNVQENPEVERAAGIRQGHNPRK